MIDSTTHGRLTVSTDGNAGPYLIVPLPQLKQLKQVLAKHRIPFSAENTGISMNGKPVEVVVNLGRGADVAKIQAILDSTK